MGQAGDHLGRVGQTGGLCATEPRGVRAQPAVGLGQGIAAELTGKWRPAH